MTPSFDSQNLDAVSRLCAKFQVERVYLSCASECSIDNLIPPSKEGFQKFSLRVISMYGMVPAVGFF